jgi:LuxR family maltose regulon positive regulatory protein
MSVRPAATDPQWFAQDLVEAVNERGFTAERPTFSGSLDPAAWHLGVLPAIEHLVSAISTPFVLVIDDAGALRGAAWESLVGSLASSLPVGAQVAMATRDVVPATLWRLRSRDQVVVMGPDVLAMDRSEAAQLMDALGVTLTDEQVDHVVRETGGWPVAVYLAGASARALPRSGTPPVTVSGINGLREYLREEIRGKLPRDDAQFLARVSVLSMLDERACDEIAGTTGSLGRLRRLAAVNHLLVAQDSRSERFRMHPLLGDFLAEELREEDPSAWSAAHVAASGVGERRGDLNGAVHHAKLARDDERLAELVWSHTGELLGSGQWAVLRRWLDGIEDDRLRGRCGLALSAAWVASHAGDMVRMSRFALAASEVARHENRDFLLDADLLAATIGADGLGQIERATRAFIEEKPFDDPWQTLAHFLLGVALFMRDEYEESAAVIGEGYRLAVALEVPVMMAHCLTGLADVALALGDDERALARIRESRELVGRYGIDTIALAAPIFTTSAVGYVLERRFADARREAARALRFTALMRSVAPWHAVQGRLALARVNLTLGDPQRAKVLLEEADDARGPATTSPRLDRLYEETRERLAEVSTGLDGTSALTTAEVRVLQYLPTHLSFPQIADELFVSRHTVKTQALSAYRKLGVHTRTEAIERARTAGLLPPA